MIFRRLMAIVRKHPQRIAFADGEDPEVILAASMYSAHRLGTAVLVGNPERIKKAAKRAKISLAGIGIIPLPSPLADSFAKEYYELRKEKGVDPETARAKMQLPNYVAIMHLHRDLVDGVVSGYESATKPFFPAFEIIRTRAGVHRASSFFLMTKSRSAYLFADCGLQINPGAEDLAEIAILTAQTAKNLGITPRVALLSFSTQGTAKGPEVEKVQQATKFAQLARPDLEIEGEMQLDAAILPKVCRKKYPNSRIMGGANVLIFPTLDAGNIGYKIAATLGKYHAVGPLIQGLQKPVQDLSRGASATDIFDSAIVAAHQAVQAKAASDPARAGARAKKSAAP